MIVHNLALKLKDGSRENVAKVREQLLAMRGRIEGLRELTVAADIRRAESSYDLVLIAKFSSMEDFQAYLPHPVHVEVGGRLQGELAAAAAVCYEE